MGLQLIIDLDRAPVSAWKPALSSCLLAWSAAYGALPASIPFL